MNENEGCPSCGFWQCSGQCGYTDPTPCQCGCWQCLGCDEPPLDEED